MSKETYYFTHDYNARNDSKIKKLISIHGYTGYGIFWAIIEDLYNNTNVLRLDYESISFDLRSTPPTIESIINDFDLFVFEGENFGSLSVQKRLDERSLKSKKAIESIRKRWDNKGKHTNVLPTNYDSNTIKGKEKKRKEKNIKINNKIFFVDSDFFDKNKFQEAFPEWAKQKLSYYYESALRYSNEGNKYVDWKAAVNNWAKKDEIQGKLNFSMPKSNNLLQGTI